jgi:replication fork clamp-binding protein CrfC
MTEINPSCVNLQENVQTLLDLSLQEPSLRGQQNIGAIETSLKKAVSPTFEIVFAGAFSAGKSMLINALLERELLYSAEGHATGTECYIHHAKKDEERVVLTFLSGVEIAEQASAICQKLGLTNSPNINEEEVINLLKKITSEIIEKEGGNQKSERAKQAHALHLLLEGFVNNKDRIDSVKNNTFSMAQFNFSNLSEAATYARMGSNSAVLKRIEYYCEHPLLEDGNILVDTPGIDAPVKKDAELIYRKLDNPDTSAVVMVLKPAAAGDLISEETELIETMRSNLSIRDRVFHVFNRIDETWYNGQLRQRLDDLINTQFRDSSRIYKTSGLLGFYGSQIKQTNSQNRFGLDSIFAESVKSMGGEEDTPQFVSEFNRYCSGGKLFGTDFKPSVHGYLTPNQNYVNILAEWGFPLIDQLIKDSGIEQFREGITRYLTEEKRPQLFATLADDLQPLCINLTRFYEEKYRNLDSQPREIEGMKSLELTRLNHQLQDIGNNFHKHISEVVDNTVNNNDQNFDEDFKKLKARMVSRMDELLSTFSVKNAYSRATLNHPRNQTAPLMAVLVEALYYLANELEDVLVEFSELVAKNFFLRLKEQIKQQEYYRQLYRLLGSDAGIENTLNELEKTVIKALANQATTECDRYVRESPRFYDDGTFSLYQFRQILQQVGQDYSIESMVQSEPAIRQLLKLDFEPKVKATIGSNFNQVIKQTLKTDLLKVSKQMANEILQQYGLARENLEKVLQKEAAEKIAKNEALLSDIKQQINQYNAAVSGINNCLESMAIYERKLPLISDINYQEIEEE